MAIQLRCGDGSEVRLPKRCFEKMSLFSDPNIAGASSYTLQCKASPQLVNLLLDRIDGESEVTITKQNFAELQSLCRELGFSGLDKELREFRQDPNPETFDTKDFLSLKERVAGHDKRLLEIQRQLHELLTWKRKTEPEMRDSISRQFHILETKVDEVARLCDQRNIEITQKTEESLKECVKQSDFESLVRDVTQLKESEKKTPARPTLTHTRQFICYESSPLNGIISHLTRECGGNVDDKGIVSVTASTVQSEKYRPKYVVDFETEAYYASGPEPLLKNEASLWICYDFKERRVIPTSYSVKSHHFGPGHGHLKSWVIEVSEDGTKNSWVKIDQQDNNFELNGRGVVRNFRISNVPAESFRFFRLRQTGPNHRMEHYLAICALEIFGTLLEK